MITEDLRAYLIAEPSITAIVDDRVHYLHPPQKYKGAYIWLARSSIDTDTQTLDESDKPYADEESFTIECISTTHNESQNLASAVKRLSGRHGISTFGNGRCQCLMVDSHSDDYIPHGTGGDDGRDVAALDITVSKYKES
jgi:hypothetical protein